MSTLTRRRWRRTKDRRTVRTRSGGGGFFDFLGDVVEGIFDFFD